jgi:hypothetical protein
MLKPELDELIEQYEIEKNNLDLLIQECLLELDYLGAHYHLQAMQEVNFKLQTLQNLKDPFFDSKDHLETMKSFFQRSMPDPNARMNDYYRDQINDLEKKIFDLNNKKITVRLDGQEFDDAIYDIIEGKINGFRFHLIKEQNLYLDFHLKDKKTLIISFTPMDYLIGKFVLSDSTLHTLKVIGFDLSVENNRLQYVYDVKTFRNSIFLKTLVSRIVFDAWYYKEFDNPASIEYK